MKGATHGVWDVEGGGPSLDDRLQHTVQEARLCPASVLRAELDIVAPAALQVLDGLHCVFHNLQWRRLVFGAVGSDVACMFKEVLWKQGLW